MGSASEGSVPINWRDNAGAAWVREEARIDATLSAFGLAAIGQLALKSGESVLDVGCGSGQTLLEIAARVASSGRVVGVDVSAIMVERAKQRSAELPQVSVLLGDAATQAFEPEEFDAIFSRFGVMFFDDTRAACANLVAGLKRSGRLAFVCWQSLERNPWALLPLMAVREVLRLEALPDYLLEARPGPFRFAEPEPLAEALASAHCRAIEVKPLELQVQLGGAHTLEEVVDYSMQVGPASRLLGDADATVREAVAAAMRRELAPLCSERGVFADARAWLVTASR